MNAINHTSRSLDYQPCHYGSARILFRGPQKPLNGAYIACLGGTETFGKFIETPFPALLEQATGTVTVNLGSLDAGIDAFVCSPGLTDIAANARATVIQIMGAANMSNRFYTVDPRRNDRFLRPSKALKEIYPEVNFRSYDRVDQMLAALARIGPDRLHLVRKELQTAWVARMRTLIAQIGGPVVLLWAADHAPYSNATGGTICRTPLFIDRAMLRAIQTGDTRLVEVVGDPQDIAMGLQDMVGSLFERPGATDLLGPIVHRRIADALTPILSDIVGTPHPAREKPLLLA
jgi:hypothetical protein